MNEINYKANMLQMKALNLTYSTVIIVKSERKQEWARSRTDKAELRRRSQEMKNPTDNALQFPLYTRTTNQTTSWMGCEGHQVETVQQLQNLAYERWGQVWHPALQSHTELMVKLIVIRQYVCHMWLLNIDQICHLLSQVEVLDDQETVPACSESILGVHTNTLLLKLLWC